ncbi:tetratricopeptide repeat protein [Nonomuraea sp. H19]|uniref:tetratricopeptide repeat protein n=1 Tax=Nonomuraea sp. H19 TaxID=3452206 RepID=UPI003F8C20A0
MRDAELAQAVRLREEGEPEQARLLLIDLARRHPDDAEVAYQTAWVHDLLGLETEAVPYYETALAEAGLSAAHRLGAYTGYGSTLRGLGRYEQALEVFRRGLEEFPGDGALRTFMAMALHNTGRSGEAVSTLLKVVAESDKAGGYRRAIEYYADNLDEIFS